MAAVSVRITRAPSRIGIYPQCNAAVLSGLRKSAFRTDQQHGFAPGFGLIMQRRRASLAAEYILHLVSIWFVAAIP